MKKIISIASIAILFSQVSFAETTRTIYTNPITYKFKPLNEASPDPVAETTTETTIPNTSPITYTFKPSNVASLDPVAETNTETTIPTQSKTENNTKETAQVETSNVASPNPVVETTTESTIPTQSKTENNINEAAIVEVSNLAKAETSNVAKAEPSNSESKTEGSYAGLDLFGTKTTLEVITVETPTSCPKDCRIKQKPALTNNSYGLGLTYKYAFNFDNFFIAPGIFFEQNNYQAVSGINGSLSRLQIKNRYGIRSDFGYDIGRFAPYLTIGYAEVSYKSRSGGYDINSNRVSSIKNGVNGNIFYGAGLKFNLTSSLSLNTEYNFQKIVLKTNLSPLMQDYITRMAFQVRMETVKAGLYYKF
jgi:opacity protein-like surface antigen